MLRRWALYGTTCLARLEPVASNREDFSVISFRIQSTRRTTAPGQPYPYTDQFCAPIGDSLSRLLSPFPEASCKKCQQAVRYEPSGSIGIGYKNQFNYHARTLDHCRRRTRDGGVGSSYSPELVQVSLEYGQWDKLFPFGLVPRSELGLDTQPRVTARLRGGTELPSQ